jgi:hypothetical protein
MSILVLSLNNKTKSSRPEQPLCSVDFGEANSGVIPFAFIVLPSVEQETRRPQTSFGRRPKLGGDNIFTAARPSTSVGFSRPISHSRDETSCDQISENTSAWTGTQKDRSPSCASLAGTGHDFN